MDVATARTFLAAASTGSFAAAALRVNASAPAVTERIKQLEHLLGVRLFDRDKRGCRLTSAGRRLIEPAQAFVQAWEDARESVTLPPRLSKVVRVGGQHALWPSLLIPWLKQVGIEMPYLAVRAVAAAPAQLNRAIEDGELDMTFLYDPMRGSGLRIEELAPDRLILVTADADLPWPENFARLRWGERAQAEILARYGDLPAAGLDLDLGVLSLEWLVSAKASGFVPERLARHHFGIGALSPVPGAPSVEFSQFVCWRKDLDPAMTENLIALARQQMAIHP